MLTLTQEYKISARLTFSNSLLGEEHLQDRKCNALCELFEKQTEIKNGVILHSELLLDYLRNTCPDLYFVSSTTKVLTDFQRFLEEVDREEFRYVVPDFRLNKVFDKLKQMGDSQKEKVEFLCNDGCCLAAKTEKPVTNPSVGKTWGKAAREHHCHAPGAEDGYLFSKAMMNPGFISVTDIQDVYRPMGFSNFKIEGRGLGSALILEFLLYYMARPEYQIHVREKIYLDTMLDLF